MSIKNLYPETKPSLLLDFANTKSLDPRITFARASGATYYDGVTTAKAEENFFLYSQEFDNAAWDKNAGSITANNTITAPDGTVTAETFTESSSGFDGPRLSSASLENYISGKKYVLSAFMKANTQNYGFLTFRISPSNVAGAVFDLLNGLVHSTYDIGAADYIDSGIDDFGNGWYRCWVIFQANTSTTSGFAFIGISNGSGLGAGGYPTYTLSSKSIYIWGAQLEQRSAVTAYTPTTDQPITNYIPVLQTASANVPRFDHDPVTGESLGLLVEEQRTNLLLRSEDFANAYWTKSFATVTSNTIVAPDGTLTMDKLVENTSGNFHYIRRLQTTTTGTVYTLSVFAKKAERHIIGVQQQNSGSTFGYVNFDLNSGVVLSAGNGLTTSAGTIQSIGNGVYRCSITFTATSAEFRDSIFLIKNADNHTGYTGDGVSGIYIWGAQLEAGAFPTSYIKTEASQVTRSADSAIMTGTNFSDWYRADEGTVYAEGVVVGGASNAGQVFLSISDNTADNLFELRQYLTTTQKFSQQVVEANNSLQASRSVVVTSDVLDEKQILSYKVNDFAFTANGVAVTTDNFGILPSVNTLKIGARGDNTFYLNGHIKKIAYYPQRLSNEQLQALTS